MNTVVNFITHEKTAITTIGVAVLLAAADQLQKGRIDWRDLLCVALTALAGVAKSALGFSPPRKD